MYHAKGSKQVNSLLFLFYQTNTYSHANQNIKESRTGFIRMSHPYTHGYIYRHILAIKEERSFENLCSTDTNGSQVSLRKRINKVCEREREPGKKWAEMKISLDSFSKDITYFMDT